jgi:hypothetical protein
VFTDYFITKNVSPRRHPVPASSVIIIRHHYLKNSFSAFPPSCCTEILDRHFFCHRPWLSQSILFNPKRHTQKEKKRKYLKPCLEQRRHFTPFVVSTDGLIGKEAKTLLKKLSFLLAEKWEKPYSVVCGYVNAQVSIAIVRATHLARLSSPYQSHDQRSSSSVGRQSRIRSLSPFLLDFKTRDKLIPPRLIRYLLSVALSTPHFCVWWYDGKVDHLLHSTLSDDMRLQATIYCAPLCLERLQLTLCYALFSAVRSNLSGKTTAGYLLRSTLSDGIALQPTIFCAPTINCTLLCLARVQLTLYCTLLCLARRQPTTCSAPLSSTTLCLAILQSISQ